MTFLLVAVVIAVMATFLVIHPLVYRRWGLLEDPVPGQAVDREARKRVALAALKEVEYDRAAGKLDDSDYTSLRTQLELEAVTVLRHSVPAVAGSEESLSAHACGFENPTGSRFCAGCGQRLT